MTLRHIGLFEGIGGFSLAARWMGWETIAWCEWNEFGQRVLKYHFPKAEGHGDITVTDFRPYRGKCDILTGGFPCQPYSSAGKRLGKEDDRHLWPEMLRAVREVRPKWVVGENVLGIVNWNDGLVFDEVQADLEAEGYEVQPYVLPACAVNAPHRRDRTWFVAHSNGTIKEHGRGKDLEEKGKVWRNEKGDVLGELHGVGASSNTNGGCEQGECKCRSGKGKSGRCNCKAFTDTNSGRLTSKEHRKEESGQYSEKGISEWFQDFPTKPPVCGRNDGISRKIHFETISKEHRMDRDLVIKKALEQGRLIADHETGEIFSTTLRGKKGEKLKLQGSDCNGYRVHNIYMDGIKKQCRAHQIVWISANGLYDKDKMMIDHINRDKTDNRLKNLRLVDASGNRNNREENTGKFTQEEKDLMHELHTNGHMSFRELSEHFDCSKSRVHQIVSEHNGIYSITFPKWRNESIKAYGNAIVPAVAYQIFKSIEKYEELCKKQV